MSVKRTLRAGRLPARSLIGTGIVAALSLATVPLPAAAGVMPAPATTAAAASSAGGMAITDFYRARAGQPLWLADESAGAANALVALLESAQADGLDPDQFGTERLRVALRAAWGRDKRAVDRAETLLSQAFVAYASELRRAPEAGMRFVDAELAPFAPPPRALLEQAARADSLEEHIRGLGWMNPIYGRLRQALVAADGLDDNERQTLRLNLERARALPPASGRMVLVNAAAQRLEMIEDGRTVDTMRVVVGKPHQPTPMMAALIRYASLNPYWNVPPDLAAERIAPNVVKDGVGYLAENGYEVLSDWTRNARPVDPEGIDWAAVANGETEVRLRQLPGPQNAMGQMKFMFPNSDGVYLHDTPDKQLLEEASRLFSGGCVRLEDAPRLARWLYGRRLEPKGAAPEQRVALAKPVPVVLTYLTAVPDGSRIAFLDDIYGRDSARLAQLHEGAAVASR